MDEPRDVHPLGRVGPVYDRLVTGGETPALRDGLAAADRPVKRVVDVAGGTRRHLRKLGYQDAVVVDTSPTVLERARDDGHPVVRADPAALPFPDDSLDALLLVEVLHLMRSVDGVLSEAARTLRPGGVVVVRELDPSTLPGRAVRVLEQLFGAHSSPLTPRELSLRMEAAGLAPRRPTEGWTYTAAGVLSDCTTS